MLHSSECSPLPPHPSFLFNGCPNASGHQPPLSSHIWLESCLLWTLTALFIWIRLVTRALVTILTVVWDCHHSLNCSGGEEGRAITWTFASASPVLRPHKRLIASADLARKGPSIHSGGIGEHLDNRPTAVGSRENCLDILLYTSHTLWYLKNGKWFGLCLLGMCHFYIFITFFASTYSPLGFLSFSPFLSCLTGLLLFLSPLFDLHTFYKSLRGFLPLFKLPLFSHEYLSNCYNWALIKLAAEEDAGSVKAGNVLTHASSPDSLKLWGASYNNKLS